MAKPRKFATAYQDSKGFWWSEDEDGNKIPVDPYTDDEGFTGYKQVDRRFTEDTTTGAGLSPDAWRWKSGQVLTPQDMQEISRVMSTPGAYVGVDGPMSVEQYLADPRSAVKVENGQYVYRPEQAKGDWESIDRESFMESLGAIPFIAGSFALPYLSSLGVIGPGASVMGQTGNMNFLGDMTNLAANTASPITAAGGGAAELASVGETGSSMLGETLPNSLAPTTGTYEQLYEMAPQSNPLELTQNFSESLNPTLNELTNPINPVNTNLTTEGMNTIDELINSITSGGTQTVGSVGSGVGSIASGVGVSNLVSGATTAAGGIFSEIARALGLPGVEEMMKKSQTDPFLSTLIRGLTLYQQGKTGDEALDLMRQGIERSDPFGPQRQFYQDRLKQSYTDPNFFKNDPTLSGIRNMAMNDVSRTAAARGYNNSSNLLYNIGQRLSDEGTKYALGYQNQLGQLAGGGISPAGVAQASAQGANLVTQQGNQQSGNWGNFISSLPNAINQVDKLTTPSSMP